MARKGKEIAIFAGLSVLMGAVGGLVGAGFAATVSAVTALREQAGWLLFLLPVAGLLSVWITRATKSGGCTTADVWASAGEKGKPLPTFLSVSVFFGTVLTHLFGGSAGKEGVALQIGGGLAVAADTCLHVGERRKRTLTLCGMAALFAAVFGTPLTAAVFVLEGARVKRDRLWECLPCSVSAWTAAAVARLLGVHPERLPLTMDGVDVRLFAGLLGAVLVSALVGTVFVRTVHLVTAKAERWIRSDYLRIAVGGVLVVGLTLLIGHRDYNGSSMAALCTIFEEGRVAYGAFALKLLLTAITLGFGFKGGELIPALFIGAAAGGALAMCVGVSVPPMAAAGLLAAFCAVTNGTLSAVLIGLELFGGACWPYLAVAALLSRALLMAGGRVFSKQ